MPGEVFGEADLIIRVRLDEAQQELDRFEREVNDQTNRVQMAQQQTVASVNTAAENAENGIGVLGRVGQAVGAWKLLTFAIKGAGAATASIPAIAAAATGAMIALATGGILLVVNAADKMVASIERAGGAIAESVSAARQLDGTKGSILALGQALEEIPIVGGAASLAFRVFSGDAEVADRALMGMMATVEDGEVKIGGFKRFIARGVGLGGMVREIDEVNEKIREFNQLTADMVARGGRVSTSSTSFGSASESSGDAATLAGLDGVQRIRAENEIAHREAMDQINSQAMAHKEAANHRMQFIREQMQQEEISAASGRRRMAAIQSELDKLESDRRDTADKVSRDLRRAGDERIRQAEKLSAIEDRRALAAARSAELAAGGDALGSTLVMNEHRRQEAVLAAQESGQSQRIQSINRYYDATARIARDAADQQARDETDRQGARLATLREAQAREARAREAASGIRRENIQSEIRSQTMRNEGDEFGARREEIMNRFKAQIEEAIQSGDMSFLKALQDLRELRLAALDAEERDAKMRDAEREKDASDQSVRREAMGQARQVDTALGFLTGDESKREEKQMVAEQKKTNNLLKKGQVAVAG